MKKWIAGTLALACILTLAACASKKKDGDDLAYILANKKLIIGITENEPMNYHDENGALVGFDTEFTEAVCAALGIEPVFQEIDWDTKEIELKSKKIDCIWNGLTVTEPRRLEMAFTESYLENRQVIVARAADAGAYAEKTDFADKTLVAEAGSAGEDAIASDLADVKYTAVTSQANALLEVKAGTADAAVIDYTMARALTRAGSDYADLVLLDIRLSEDGNEEYAIGFRLGSTAVARVNEIIGALAADGTLTAIAERYGVKDLLLK